jgi:endonuclease-3
MRDAAQALEIMEIFRQRDPNPRCELNFSNAYTLLVAVVLSAQTTDKGVNRATQELFRLADTPQKMIELGTENLRRLIKTIGLYNNKSKNIMALSQTLVDRYNGVVPHDRRALENLPGVGRKTANVVLNVWFHEATLAVDTHVFRVAHRLELSQGKTPLSVEQDLVRILPPEYVKNANHWLVLFGRYVCTARQPHCPECPIAQFCRSTDKTIS